MNEMVNETLPELEKGIRTLSTGTAVHPKILIADPYKKWQDFYRQNLEDIAHIVVVDNYVDAYKTLLKPDDSGAYAKGSNFNAYIIDPVLPSSRSKESEIKKWDFNKGLLLVDRIREIEGGNDWVCIVSENHESLYSIRDRTGLKRVYTKNPPEKSAGFRTKEKFLEDIRSALSEGYSSLSGPF